MYIIKISIKLFIPFWNSQIFTLNLMATLIRLVVTRKVRSSVIPGMNFNLIHFEILLPCMNFNLYCFDKIKGGKP